MDYLTNYYKNLSEQLQARVNRLSYQIKFLNESESPTQFPVQDYQKPGSPEYYPLDPYNVPPGGWEEEHNIPHLWDGEDPDFVYPFPVWWHDSTPPKGWDGWWPDAPDGDPRQQKPTEWPRGPFDPGGVA